MDKTGAKPLFICDEGDFCKPLTAVEWGLTEPVYPRVEGFKKVGVKTTKGHQLIAAGELEIIKNGATTVITTPSIVAYLNKRRIADNPVLQSSAK
jgi:hypothetical protein